MEAAAPLGKGGGGAGVDSLALSLAFRGKAMSRGASRGSDERWSSRRPEDWKRRMRAKKSSSGTVGAAGGIGVAPSVGNALR